MSSGDRSRAIFAFFQRSSRRSTKSLPSGRFPIKPKPPAALEESKPTHDDLLIGAREPME
jgi:hypothetical protein